jgi:prevent-host-death family protein
MLLSVGEGGHVKDIDTTAIPRDATKQYPIVLCRYLYSGGVSSLPTVETLSVSEASARGIAGLVRDAQHGHEVVVARHGLPVAAIVGIDRLHHLDELERDLRSACLVLSRIATDDGLRTPLDTAISRFGFTRAELTAELERDIAGGRE